MEFQNQNQKHRFNRCYEIQFFNCPNFKDEMCQNDLTVGECYFYELHKVFGGQI